MKVRAFFLATAITATACGHTHVANDTPKQEPEKENAPKKEPAQKEPARAANKTPTHTRSPEGVPLATSPAGALAEGAVGDIQEKLVASGHLASRDKSDRLDEPTQRALRELQKERHLPATGMPDDATIRALGLDANKVFRRAGSE